MNNIDPELKKRLIETLIWFIESLKSAGQFVLDQLPLVAQEAIAYGRAYYGAWIVFILIASAIAWLWSTKIKKSDDPDANALGWALGVAGTIIPGCFGIYNTMQLLKVMFAPRIYLIEWAISLLNQLTGTPTK